MAISVNYRGDVKAKEANATVQWLKTNKKVSFVEWVPTGFHMGINEEFIATDRKRDSFSASIRGVVMIGNNTAISKKYDLMYSQKAFVHWYIREEMEEGEFTEAREDLEFLEKDYLDVLSEQFTKETESDEEEEEM